MAHLIVFEINHNVMTLTLENEFKKLAKYYARFERHSIIFLLDTQVVETNKIIFKIFKTNDVIVDKQQLNEFAKNRLFKNLIDDFPELIITMLDCSDKITLIKARKKNG